MKRYIKNQNMLSQEECALLRKKRICVVGCGGLGGYVIELLARIGVGHLTVIDGDVFDETNLNRQLLCTEGNLGRLKADAAKLRVASINSEVSVTAICEKLSATNALDMIKDHDVVLDALDHIGTRLILEEKCTEAGLPMVHGAIAGWYGQVAVVLPGRPLLKQIYKPPYEKGMETSLGNPSFTPALVAALEVSETIKLLLGKADFSAHRILRIDLLANEFETLILD